jgi:arylsulfatase A-like enzyme
VSPPPVTRRRLIQQAGASAALAAGLPAAARAALPADRPNVVVIVVDTFRADHAFGNRARTPNFDALTREGLSFTRFFPEAMPTVPARRSILSGRRTFPFRGWHPYSGLLPEPGWAPLGDVQGAFTSVLRRAGYWTAYATDNTSLGFSPPWRGFRHSFDRFVRRGGQFGGRSDGVSAAELRHWLPPEIDDPDNRDRILRYLANGRYSHDETKSFAARVFRDGARVLEEAVRHRPFALVVDTFEPHEPWTPPRRYVDMYGDPDYHGPEPARPYYAAASRYLHGARGQVLLDRMRALYAAEVTMTDRWMGVFLDKLHDLGLENDTVILLVSDHGIYLGDHGYTGKIPSRLHPELIHVPLVIVHPERRRAGQRSRYFAQTHDVAPTVLAMAGVPAPGSMNGVDLSGLFGGGQPHARPYAYGGYTNSFYIRTERWKLFGDNRGRDFHLHDPRRDSNEYRNVAASHRKTSAHLYRTVRRRAGGALPYYDG